jgi:mono/diheme cytochrome c family protein
MQTTTAILSLAVLFSAAPQAPATVTVLDGVYSEEQAQRGHAAYMTHCASCHSEDLSGRNAARPLTGEDFMDRWREYDLEPLFTMIKTQMPPRRGRPDSAVQLSDQEYLDILTYVLKGNDYPTGNDELRMENLERILLVGKNGPQPVPGGALVRVVGCLAQTGEQWVVVNATEPARAKESDKTSPAELESSRAMPAGNGRFRLVNFDYIAPDFRPDPFRAQRVQAKGFLVRQPNAERINITSLETVAPTCP